MIKIYQSKTNSQDNQTKNVASLLSFSLASLSKQFSQDIPKQKQVKPAQSVALTPLYVPAIKHIELNGYLNRLHLHNQFNLEPVEYFKSLSKSHIKIAQLFLSYRGKDFIALTIQTIARQTDCCKNTVIRAIKILCADGFIKKIRDHGYRATNYYMLAPKLPTRPDSSVYFHNPESKRPRDLKNSSFAICLRDSVKIVSQRNETYIYNKSYSSQELSLLNKTINAETSVWLKTIYVRREKLKKLGYTQSRVEMVREEKVFEGMHMLRLDQKQWILDHKNSPTVKNLLSNERARSLILSPIISDIAQLFQLDDNNQLKLIRFPDEALQYAYQQIKPICDGDKEMKNPILDGLGYFISLANAYCAKNHLDLQWDWYNKLAMAMGIPRDLPYQEPKPLTINQANIAEKKRVLDDRKARIRNGHSPQVEHVIIALPAQVAVEKLQKDITELEYKISKPDEYPGTIFYEIRLSAAREELIKLQDSILSQATVH